MEENKRFFWIVFVCFLGLYVLLMLFQRIYPFTDLPNHLAVATIYKLYGNAGTRFHDFYYIDRLFQPNVFYALFCSLPFFPSVEMANKIFYCVYVVLLPVSVFLVIRKAGGNPWFSLLSFLLLYNYSVTWGFVGYTIALPFVMLLFYFLLGYLESGCAKYKGAIAGLFMLLFSMHGQMVLFSLAIFYICCFYFNRHSLSAMLKALIPSIPAVMLIFAWVTAGGGIKSETNSFEILYNYYLGGEYFQTFGQRIINLLQFDNYGLYEGLTGTAVGAVFSLVILLVLVLAIAGWRRTQSAREIKIVAVWWFFGLSLFCYWVLPREMSGHGIIYERCSVFFLLSAVVLSSVILPESFLRSKVLNGAFVVVCLLHVVLWAGYFKDFQQENQLFTREFFKQAGQEGTLVGVLYDNKFRGRPVYMHFPNYYIVWEYGITSNSFTEYRFGTVRRKVGYDVLPVYNEWIEYNKEYVGRYANMDLLLVRGDVPAMPNAFFDRFELKQQAGEWSLFRSKQVVNKVGF